MFSDYTGWEDIRKLKYLLKDKFPDKHDSDLDLNTWLEDKAQKAYFYHVDNEPMFLVTLLINPDKPSDVLNLSAVFFKKNFCFKNFCTLMKFISAKYDSVNFCTNPGSITDGIIQNVLRTLGDETFKPVLTVYRYEKKTGYRK